MKKAVLLLFIVAGFQSFAQKNMGIGLKVGSLNGITFKKYSAVSDIEINLGHSYAYNTNLTRWDAYFYDVWIIKNGNVASDWKFKDVRVYTPVAIQGRLLFHKNLNKIGDESVSGLKWYYGIGGQLVSRRVDFIVEYLGTKYVESYNDIDLGVDGIIGLEYTLEDIPLAFFLDVNLLIELIDEPFVLWPQAGLGGRFRF